MSGTPRWRAALCVFALVRASDLCAQQPLDVKPEAPQARSEGSERELAIADPEIVNGKKPRPDEWEFEFTPYFWMTSITADVSIGPLSATSDACFTDIVKHLDMGAMLRFEGRRDNWGFYIEGLYVGLSDDSQMKVGPFRVRGLETDVRLTLADLDLGAMYRFGTPERGVDLMLGARYVHAESDLEVDPFIDVKNNTDFVAPVVGGRLQLELAEKWLFSFRADVGGFGICDAPDLTWGATALLGYRMSDRATLGFGYRYYDFGASDNLELKFHGPFMGVAFKF